MTDLARVLLAELDDEALDELAARLAPRLAAHARTPLPPPVGGEQALTVADAARLLNVHERTLRRAIDRGALAASKPAGRWRITPADLDAWAAAPTPRRTPGRRRGGPGAQSARTRPLAAALAGRDAS